MNSSQQLPEDGRKIHGRMNIYNNIYTRRLTFLQIPHFVDEYKSFESKDLFANWIYEL